MHVKLYSCSIFYLPEEYQDIAILNANLSKSGISISANQLEQIYHNFLCLNEFSEFKILKNTENLQNTLTLKKIRLESNLLKLIELQGLASVESFKFILNKYYEQLLYFKDLTLKLVDEFFETFEVNDNEFYNLLQYQKTIFDLHYLDFYNQFKDFGEVDIKKKVTKPVLKTTFEEFINHEERKKISKMIELKYCNLYGMNVRFLYEFMQEKNLLDLNTTTKTELIKATEKLFQKKIGAYTSIFAKNVFNKSDPNYKSARIGFIENFKPLINS